MKHDPFLTKRYGTHLAVLLLVLGGVLLISVFVRAHIATNTIVQNIEHTQSATPALLR